MNLHLLFGNINRRLAAAKDVLLGGKLDLEPPTRKLWLGFKGEEDLVCFLSTSDMPHKDATGQKRACPIYCFTDLLLMAEQQSSSHAPMRRD